MNSLQMSPHGEAEIFSAQPASMSLSAALLHCSRTVAGAEGQPVRRFSQPGAAGIFRRHYCISPQPPPPPREEEVARLPKPGCFAVSPRLSHFAGIWRRRDIFSRFSADIARRRAFRCVSRPDAAARLPSAFRKLSAVFLHDTLIASLQAGRSDMMLRRVSRYAGMPSPPAA